MEQNSGGVDKRDDMKTTRSWSAGRECDHRHDLVRSSESSSKEGRLSTGSFATKQQTAEIHPKALGSNKDTAHEEHHARHSRRVTGSGPGRRAARR